MTFSWDVNVVALVGLVTTIVLQFIALVVFLVKTNGKAVSAYSLAQEARGHAEEAHDKITLLTASLSLLREHVAKEYADHEALGAMEKRLTNIIDRLSTRIDKVLDTRK